MKIFIPICAVLLIAGGVVFADDRDDVPDYILEEIKEMAAEKYPGKYSMQKFKIDMEVKAYIAIQNYSDNRIPADILNEIMDKATEKYPGKYSIQKFKLDMEVKAYLDIHN